MIVEGGRFGAIGGAIGETPPLLQRLRKTVRRLGDTADKEKSRQSAKYLHGRHLPDILF